VWRGRGQGGRRRSSQTLDAGLATPALGWNFGVHLRHESGGTAARAKKGGLATALPLDPCLEENG